MMRGRLLNMLFVRQQTAALFFFVLLLLLLYFGWGQKLSHNLGIIRALSSEAPIGMAGYPNWIGGIASNRIENKIKVKIEFEISTAICESCLSFARARWILPGSIPEIVKLFS